MCKYILLLSLHQYFLKQTGRDYHNLMSNLLALPKLILSIFSVIFIIHFRYIIHTLYSILSPSLVYFLETCTWSKLPNC